MSSLLFLVGLCEGCRYCALVGPKLVDGPGEPERTLRKMRSACCNRQIEWRRSLPLIWLDGGTVPQVFA